MNSKIVLDFTELADNLPDIIARFDAEGRYVYVNKKIESETGLPSSTFIGKNHRELNFSEDMVEIWERSLHKVIEIGTLLSFDFNYDISQGQSVYEARLIPEKNTNGKVETILAVIRNISNNTNDPAKRRIENPGDEDILSPKNEIDKLDLSDIIVVKDLQELMDNFYNLTHITTAIIDTKGKVLVGVGWQNICTKFHRTNPDTLLNCIESDTELTTDIPDGDFKLYKCKNGLWDLATPIIVGGEHKGNLFMGQFFFDDEPIDYEFFKLQAKQFGFDEIAYITALEKVPRLNTKDIDSAKAFFSKLARSISQLSYSNIKLSRLLDERNNILDSLRQSEDRFRSIFEKPKAIMLLIDPEDGHIIDANLAAVEFYGYAREKLCTMKIQDINQLSPEEVSRERASALNESRNYFIFPHGLANKDIRWVEVYSSPILIGNKQILFSIIHDITERKEAEDQLRKLSSAVEQSPNIIIITDASGNIEYANPEFTRITEYQVEEVLGKNPRIFKSGTTNPALYKKLWQTILSGNQWHGAFQNKKKSGELYWESVNISPVFDAKGTITNFTAVKEDISERIKREDQLARLNRTLRALRDVGDAIVHASNEQELLNPD